MSASQYLQHPYLYIYSGHYLARSCFMPGLHSWKMCNLPFKTISRGLQYWKPHPV